jgi:hypothetical protein
VEIVWIEQWRLSRQAVEAWSPFYENKLLISAVNFAVHESDSRYIMDLDKRQLGKTIEFNKKSSYPDDISDCSIDQSGTDWLVIPKEKINLQKMTCNRRFEDHPRIICRARPSYNIGELDSGTSGHELASSF